MDRKKVISWALYDWANSAFATTVMAGFFPIFFEKYWSNPENINESTFYLGLSNSVGSLIVAALAPFLGAIADSGSTKKKFLFTFAFLGILMTSGLCMVGQGQWQMAALLYMVGSVGFAGGNVFYDSLLPSVANKKKVDFVSSLGYSLGYIGGGILFLVNVLMYQYPQWFGIPDGTIAVKLSFLSVAVWWAIFSIPILIFVPEPSRESSIKFGEAISQGWIQLKRTFKEIRQMKIIGIFLLSYWLYMDGVDTIVRMAVKVGSSMGFETGDMITALLMVQFIGFPAALVLNWFASKTGPKNVVLVAIIFYSLATCFAYFMTTRLHFFLLAGIIGLFQGGIQALSRSLFSRLVPKGKEGEFFGFYNMLGKFSAVIGPIMLGSVSLITGDVRIGLLSIVILFVAGGLILLRVDFDEGERLANTYYS
ncbi:MAG: MFS transporter [Candidatus Neomarinimicrobiota bacterium]|jgi:UMF1 family MFS transporter|uniref:Major facilitator superfamily (MFS) profile domain-containing protein n=1 Tax=marine metagenome TaxID=408172 RepID=A0A381W3J5_9ZZZZ|nr:MFS transporter [Candidatus Neomarinimicrobiota bacterium]